MENHRRILNDKYEILTEIGRGGMSIVYLAMDRRLNKQWAIKQIRKKGKSRTDEIIANSLLAEANLMKCLDHPALPRIVDILDTGDTIYIVMDYIEGEDLDRILAVEGVQSEEQVIEWGKQLCDVLSYLHSQQSPIIYRDMKPSNVMVKPDGTVKIIDFGIAREYKEENVADTTVLGTRGYAAPEQYGARQTDQRSDIYALGMTLHHLLTGVDPKSSDYLYAPVRQWNPNLSEGIEIIIDRCTQPAAENRYQTCEELLYDLEHPDLITRGYRKRQKQKLGAFGLSAGLGLLLLVTSFATRAWGDRETSDSYEVLLSVVSATAYEDKVESYKKAVDIYPENLRAYEKLLEAYEEEGRFGKRENDEFLALYNANRAQFDRTSEAYAALHYKLGMMYFNYYIEGEVPSFSTRVQKAAPFFEANYERGQQGLPFSQQALSDAYYQIGQFYRRYILNATIVEEASAENYEALFQTMQQAMTAVKTAGAYDQLSLYNAIFRLLYDQRMSLASVGVPQDSVEMLFDAVHERATALAVQKPQSRLLQEEMQKNYVLYREAIARSYKNRKDEPHG